MKKKLVPAPAASLTKRTHSAVTKAVHKYLPVLESALDDYETEHPHWRIEVLVSLIKWSLKSLKHYIEDVHDTKITWADPLVELHYPVEWNWQPRGDADIASGGHIFGTLTKQNTAKKATALKTLSKIMVAKLTTTALADLTNGVWYVKRKNYYTPLLPLDLKTELDAIKNPREQRAVFDELARPFSIGAARIDLDAAEVNPGARVPKRVLQQLDRMDAGVRDEIITLRLEQVGRQMLAKGLRRAGMSALESPSGGSPRPPFLVQKAWRMLETAI